MYPQLREKDPVKVYVWEKGETKFPNCREFPAGERYEDRVWRLEGRGPGPGPGERDPCGDRKQLPQFRHSPAGPEKTSPPALSRVPSSGNRWRSARTPSL